MVTLLAMVYNISYLGLMEGLNRLIGRLVRGNDNDYNGPTHEKLDFSYVLLILFLSVKYPHGHTNSAL